MDSRGIYTATVAILIIAIIGGTMLYFNKPSIETQAETTARSVREVKMYWENARILMDRAVSEALIKEAENGLAGGCSAHECINSIKGLQSKIDIKEDYWNDILTKIGTPTGVNCELGHANLLRGSGPKEGEYYEANAELWCEKKADGENIKATYNQQKGKINQINFKKRLVASYGTDDVCRIYAYDAQGDFTGHNYDMLFEKKCGPYVPPPTCELTLEGKTSGGSAGPYHLGYEANYKQSRWISWGYPKGDPLIDCKERVFIVTEYKNNYANLYCTCYDSHSTSTEDVSYITVTATVECISDGTIKSESMGPLPCYPSAPKHN